MQCMQLSKPGSRQGIRLFSLPFGLPVVRPARCPLALADDYQARYGLYVSHIIL